MTNNQNTLMNTLDINMNSSNKEKILEKDIKDSQVKVKFEDRATKINEISVFQNSFDISHNTTDVAKDNKHKNKLIDDKDDCINSNINYNQIGKLEISKKESDKDKQLIMIDNCNSNINNNSIRNKHTDIKESKERKDRKEKDINEFNTQTKNTAVTNNSNTKPSKSDNKDSNKENDSKKSKNNSDKNILSSSNNKISESYVNNTKSEKLIQEESREDAKQAKITEPNKFIQKESSSKVKVKSKVKLPKDISPYKSKYKSSNNKLSNKLNSNKEMINSSNNNSRLDNFGNLIVKNGNHKLVFADSLRKNLVHIVEIQSYKEYTLYSDNLNVKQKRCPCFNNCNIF